jgi:hypothetical protein
MPHADGAEPRCEPAVTTPFWSLAVGSHAVEHGVLLATGADWTSARLFFALSDKLVLH